ncbi:MAG TPA: hypothetical protein VK137_12870 [Planctomycetaceae bacterium]|nr:hypothetical protein [Planctomycetaceae bacterium]
MSETEVQKRLEALERQVATLMSRQNASPGPDDWRSTVGMFTGDELHKQIDAAGQAIREAERMAARRRSATSKKKRPTRQT